MDSRRRLRALAATSLGLLRVLPAVASILALPAAARAGGPPSVARPTYVVDGENQAHSTVFFVPAPGDEIGVVAVGAAHSFDLAKLGAAGEIRFVRPGSGVQVSVSSRYLTKPGKPFRAPGGTLRGDFIVFALDLEPKDVNVLEPERGRLDPPGSRVRILGIPNAMKQDEDDIFGSVVESGSERIEVDLDVPTDLRGWGGAPVVSAESGRVLGILEGAWPLGGTYRVGVAPIGGVLDALETPLAKGLGQPFAHYQAYDPALPPTRGNPFEAEAPPEDPLPPVKVARRPVPVTGPRVTGATDGAGATRSPRAPPPPRRYLDQEGGESDLRLEVEYPSEGAVVGNRSGGFLAGHAMAVHGEFKRFDVVFVIDTSGSTVEPTGQDVNGNGVVGKAPLGGVGAVFGLGSTDPGDSILSAEVLAARQLLEGFDSRSTRVGLVSFAGLPSDQRGGFRRRSARAAVTEEPLTTDYGQIDEALKRIFRRGPDGMTHMAAGIDQATIELLGLKGSLSEADSEAEKIVLFFTDGQPTLPYEGLEKPNVEAVLRASDRARRGGIRIHSFALGPDALEGPVAVVEMAERTDGYFTPVRDPAELIQIVEVVQFTDIREISVHNVTTETAADQVQLNADGSWTALVPLEIGKNEIEVVAVTDDGREARRTLTLQHAPGSPDPSVPRELVAHKNRLLERKLLELRRGRIAAEREAAEQTRKELRIEIERERAQAAERAARQRKELELDVETPPAGGDS